MKTMISCFLVLCGIMMHTSAVPAIDIRSNEPYRKSEVMMGTFIEITIGGGSSRADAEKAADRAFAEISRIEKIMSHTIAESEVSVVNAGAFLTKVTVSKELFEVLERAVEISSASKGAFDVTVLPVSRLWVFDMGEVVPSDTDIGKALLKVGFEKLILDTSSVSVGFKTVGMGLDLGAIAKGFAVDRAIDVLRSNGIESAIVDAGGDIRVFGSRPGGGAWRIGVQHPRKAQDLLATLEVRDSAIVTSGDYERCFVVGGQRFHHILDPATGMPARGCQSVTVLAPTAAEADACATAAFVLGPEKGLAFLRSRAGVRGLIVDADGKLHWTDRALREAAGL